MAVLSIAPSRKVWYCTSILVGAAAHALLLAVLPGGTPLRPVPADPATVEMVVVADEPQQEPTQKASSAVPVMAAVEPVTPPDVKPPVPEPAIARAAVEMPAPPTADPAPDEEQASVPEPFHASTHVEAPVDSVAPAPTFVRPAAPKPLRRPAPRRVMSRRDTVAQEAPAVFAQPEVRPAAQGVVVTMTARPTGTAPTEQRAEETLRGQIREAVQAAVRCPAAARMMGLSGKAGVAFDYRDGAVIGGVQLSRSTGTPMLDAAALAAVRDARYPNPPPEIANHRLRLLVWVEEACSA